jgi:Kef-type K+ transport system membrane component KefB
VDLNQGLVDLVAVALVAALAPLVVALLPGPRVPQVVILLLGGVLIGPHVLGLAETSNIQLMSNIGLGFLFLLAGYELDPQLLRQRPGRLAILGWMISAVIAVGGDGGAGRGRLHKGLRTGRAGADHHGAGHAAAHLAGQ